MERKIDILVRLMAAEDWEAAIRFAAKFPQLGKERAAILTAASALLAPAFYAEMGKDVEALKREGIAALKRKYASYL